MGFRVLAAAVVLLVPSAADAAPGLAQIFGDHAVLQQEVELPVWGFDADPGSRIMVRFGDLEAEAKTDANGRWEARFSPQAANAVGADLILLENGVEVARVHDVLIGEVWLATGQSNMGFQVKGMVKRMPEAAEWVNSANFPSIRYRRVNDPVLDDRDAEADDLAGGGSWVKMSPESVLNFSAVAAGFAREIADELEVPVGIIDVAWGGKPIEPFIPGEAFSAPLLERVKALADREALEELAALRGGVIIRNPQGYPGAIFNARIAPLVPYALRGFLWYQAESNAGKGEDPREYRSKMEALIGGWRARWKNEALPCYFVQLPSFPPATGWVRAREEQRLALSIPHTGMAVTIDIRGDDIHPADKLPVSERLARLALAGTYERDDGAGSGPIYREHSIEGAAVRVSFDHAEPGLMVGDRPDRGPVKETPDARLRWFEVAGEDGNWHKATAKIEGDQVIVASDAVAAPVEVRYACETKPQGANLYNRAGLPASPFCTRLDWLPWEDQAP